MCDIAAAIGLIRGAVHARHLFDFRSRLHGNGAPEPGRQRTMFPLKWTGMGRGAFRYLGLPRLR